MIYNNANNRRPTAADFMIMEMEREGTDIMSCIHHSYYDLLIDSDTGKYKSEVKNLVTGSGGNYGF